jgi:hypothetical protein
VKFLCLSAICLNVLTTFSALPRVKPPVARVMSTLVKSAPRSLVRLPSPSPIPKLEAGMTFQKWVSLTSRLEETFFKKKEYRLADFLKQAKGVFAEAQSLDQARRSRTELDSRSGGVSISSLDFTTREVQLEEALGIIFLARDFPVVIREKLVVEEDPTIEFVLRIFEALRDGVPNLTLDETVFWIEDLLRYAEATEGFEIPEDIFITLENLKNNTD